MARGSYAPQQVESAEIVQVRHKSDYPGQRRTYNYVVRVSTSDADTGEPIMVNEYRTIASNAELSSSSVLNRITSLLEENL